MACFQMSEPPSPSTMASRAAGLPSALGDVPADVRGRVLRTSTWKVVYDGSWAPKPESETREAMFSTMRDRAVRTAAREVLAGPSLSSCGAALRKSHIDVGFERPGEVEFRRQTETKQSYVQQPLPILQSAAANKEKQQMLQKSSIDLAFGVEKTGKAWQTDMSDKMLANLDRKFACEGRPAAIDGSSNYKSQVQIGDHPPGVLNEYVTETKCQFADPGRPQQLPSYAATRGKELQQHSWDFAMGRLKTTSHWMTQENAEMSRKAADKYLNRQQNIDPRLAKELRSSSVYMGKDTVEWPRQGGMPRSLSMPGMVSIGKVACRP